MAGIALHTPTYLEWHFMAADGRPPSDDDPVPMSEEFARSVILPAVAANTSLRHLSFGSELQLPALREAEALVRSRSA